MFNLLTLGIALIASLCILYAAYGVKDSLHPFVLIMPMVLYLYVWMPVQLTHSGELEAYLSRAELTLVQQFNFVCVVALALGTLVGSRISRGALDSVRQINADSPAWRLSLRRLAIFMG